MKEYLSKCCGAEALQHTMADNFKSYQCSKCKEWCKCIPAPIEYMLVQDDDAHWYVIPVDKEKDWEAWIGTEDYENGVVPKFAEAVGGSYRLVRFTNYKIL